MVQQRDAVRALGSTTADRELDFVQQSCARRLARNLPQPTVSSNALGKVTKAPAEY